MDRHEGFRWALGIIAVHNLVQNTFLNARGYVAGNITIAAALIGLGKATGLSLAEMGLRARVTQKDLRLLAITAGATAGASLAGLVHPPTRQLLRDERAQDSQIGVIAQNALIRFPIGTALFEETTFRGIMPALARRSSWGGDVISAGVFGLWHAIPTARALSGSPLSTDMTLARRVRTVVAGCAATALAGLGFSWLRRRSGSIVLPWLVHGAFNTITYLAGVAAWRIPERQS